MNFIPPSDLTYEEQTSAKEGSFLLVKGFGVKTPFRKQSRRGFLDGKPVVVSSIFVSEKDLDYTNMAVQELLLSETDRFQSLQYERLAKFHGFVLETFCFVYERVDPGLTLSEYIQQGRLITWAGRYQLALDVSNALAYLHSTKTSLGSKDETLHRLLSSNSVLLSKEGDRMRAKLYDYGISNIRNYILDVQGISKIRNEYIPQLDVSQSVFLAPENALHSEIPYTKESDVYSLGILLMELGLLKLVSQKLVIQFREESAKLKKQSNNSGDKAYSSPAPPQPLSSLPINSQMPPIVFQMIEMCLDLNSSSRPGAKHLTLYLKENTAEIITFKSEELNQEIEKAKNSSALSTPQAATAEFSKLDASKNAGIVSLKTKRQMVIDNIRKERITLSGLCLLLLVIMAILIFLIVRLTTVSNQISEITQQQAYNRHPSYSVTTGQLTLTTKSISLWPYPSPTAAPSAMRYNYGNMSLPNWAGVNSFFLHSLPESNQLEIISALQNASIKVIRIFISATSANSKNTNSTEEQDVENGAPGQFDDTILNDIDLLMVKLYAAKIKLIIETHDRYALGCWSSDVYVAKYNLPFSANCNPVNDPISFYSNVNAQTEFEARLKHIVSHVNPHFNNTPWSALDEVILSFGIENESQGYMTVRNEDWLCDRAKFLKPLVSPKILISTGGGTQFDDSLDLSSFRCPELDMIALHSYDSSELNFRKNLETAVQLAGQYNKLVVMEEFGSTSNKQTLLSMVATVCNGLGIPWMPWEVMKPGATSDFEFWIDDVLTWNALSKNAAIALAGIENSPLLSLGANCYRDSSCASGCCSNTGTFDGYYHCSQNCG